MLFQRVMALTLVLFSICCYAQQGEKFDQIIIDGKLDEGQWQNAQSYSDFVMAYPQTSKPGRWQTQSKVYTNQQGIYVGFINQQSQVSNCRYPTPKG